jgi:hypothetical protein
LVSSPTGQTAITVFIELIVITRCIRNSFASSNSAKHFRAQGIQRYVVPEAGALRTGNATQIAAAAR